MELSVIVNAHTEGDILIETLVSVSQSLKDFSSAGRTSELIVILDNGDEPTRNVIQNFQTQHSLRLYEVNVGDLGLARNVGVQQAKGRVIAFMDGDDLCSRKWLSRGYQAVSKNSNLIAHPHYNFFFGSERSWFQHPEQNSESINSLYTRNRWTALSISARATYIKIPYRANSAAEGFGFEDWTWNCETIGKGFVHLPVHGTYHFIRIWRANSLNKTSVLEGLGPRYSKEFLAKHPRLDLPAPHGRFVARHRKYFEMLLSVPGLIVGQLLSRKWIGSEKF